MSYKLINLNKRFGNTEVLKDFTIELPTKATVCLFGESGCGKTTLINTIAGLESLDSGNIDVLKDKKKSYVFQEDRLIPWLSVGENIKLVKKEKTKDTIQIKDLLESLNLHNIYDKKPNELSGGMRQRVNIARSLVVDSEIIFLDEPLKGIDEKNKMLVMKVLKSYAKDKLCILVTHQKEEALMLADKIYFLEGPPLKILDIKNVKDLRDNN